MCLIQGKESYPFSFGLLIGKMLVNVFYFTHPIYNEHSLRHQVLTLMST